MIEDKNMVWLNKIIKENKESNSPLKYTECPFEALYELEKQISQPQQEKEELLKYKNAWEELKLMVNAVAFDKVRTTMRDLETKNGI